MDEKELEETLSPFDKEEEEALRNKELKNTVDYMKSAPVESKPYKPKNVDLYDETYDFNDPNGYKIRCGAWYKLRQVVAKTGTILYFIDCKVKDMEGNQISAGKQVVLANKELRKRIPDGAFIKPKRLYETFYMKRMNGYSNAVWTVVITDWEVRLTPNGAREEAYKDFAKTKLHIDDVKILDDILPLPF